MYLISDEIYRNRYLTKTKVIAIKQQMVNCMCAAIKPLYSILTNLVKIEMMLNS